MLNRKFEDCSADFADKIIARSYKIAQKQSIFTALKAVFAEWGIPNPVYVMPVLFAFGLLVNVSVSPMTNIGEFIDGIYLNI